MPHRPSRQTATSRALSAAAGRLELWPKRRVWIVATSGLAAVILLNQFAGPYVSLLIFYMVLATFVTWCLGERPGFLIAILCVVSGLLTRRLQMPHGANPAMDPLVADVVNALGRLLTIMFAVVVVNGLRAARDMERWRGSIDALTGALNKATFEKHMGSRLREAARHRQAVVLAYIDLDGFKQVNDTLRHAAGDKLLTGFAEGALASLRAGDLFARVGGDEFAALLTARNEQEGLRAAEEFHQRLCRILDGQGFGVTCSTGAVILTPHAATDGSDLLEAADRLMYAVKADGKNGISLEVMEPASAGR